ncbi:MULTISPECIES: inosine/xanthosine triphosphatase [Xenorhabdus]|uniref:Inosine/xanthosine triphosphatase n=6 Tax=Xenorhabdus TaxID=626 RepID=A0A077PIT9_XENBV|nr:MULTISPECIES: inosine/xanthosine triphosphatase [Xenorhabdus]MBC8944937.1 non-canonical purine NTP phosphatase [Xenorhabdus indica]MDC9622563.1 inosine/xanthosine triphosphatase [Xenorhabdus aichiensis]MDE1474306.1 inosine/xanthosine triphosphatase [Xenorhabdus bovienii]MDE1478115.1 inosine/xanthosine triphosphatase [Xenorhabdus bovienii]MDE1484488.1 inosine/xanthosine triphosphatase [Xenorhabdus bovienii]
MYHVIAATTNPAKIKAISLAFDDVFGPGTYRIEDVNVDSSVPQQPIGNTETRTGARHRVMAARQVRPEADFWVGVEAGIEDDMTFAWMVIEYKQIRGESRSASLMLPEKVLEGIREGRELGHEMAYLTGVDNIKQKGGAIGFFTNGILTRTSVYHQALILALVPIHHEIYKELNNQP